jgi:hypothetical protein
MLYIAAKTDEDNFSAMPEERNESGESSDGTDSLDVEGSAHE